MRSLLSPLLIRLKAPPLATRNVLHSWRRSAVAIVGMGFAVIMVLLQLGFLQAVNITASVNYDQLDFNVALVSTLFEEFYDPGSFPKERLKQARSIANVISANPFYCRMQLWRCPAYPLGTPMTGNEPPRELNILQRWWVGGKRTRPWQRRALLLIGVELDHNPFHDPIRSQIEEHVDALRMTDRVLLNAWSNPEFGWDLRDQFQDWEMGTRRVELAGGFTLQRSFGADAAALCSDLNFARSIGLTDLDRNVNFGLLTVEPGAVEETIRELNARLPHDVIALSRADLYERERHYWVNQTATGKIFKFGVIVSMFVAAVVVYQVLSNDVRNHLSEYATLKAIGYTDLTLATVVLSQATIYALASYVPACLIGAVLYWVTESLANIPMKLTLANLGLVLLLTLSTSLISGILTVRKLRTADPAELFG